MAVTIAEDTLLVLAPPQMDLARSEQLLQQNGVKHYRCEDVAELAALAPMAGGAMVSEDSLVGVDTGALVRMLEGQPPWSDFPFLMMVERNDDADDDERLERFAKLGNVTFVEQPYLPFCFIGNVKTMLNSRQRQYRARRQFENMARVDRDLASGLERQRLLVRELHHRVKNTLATVQALMSSTARSSLTVEEFRQALLGRISAMAHVHEVLTEDKWQEAPLRALFASQLEPEAGPDFKGEARIDGPDIKIPSHLAVPLGMAVHELTINALKYGALSQAGGTVAVSWEVEAAPDRMMLRIEWREEGGPPTPVPRRRGFGSQFLERVLRQQAAADVELNYHPAGLQVIIHMPLPERTSFHLFTDA
ncbi:sensor histidine kinase [Tianweitania populi]|uniref:histidine kinase n=1 Tax=Tianweitania populi TaxID=1607949 RepID=A0A8J3GJ64_9HYPH|nr:sensor histidine kinase [Tianweitania populi]GHD10861.1 sensor histidine kinase [Tianweitania populi]